MIDRKDPIVISGAGLIGSLMALFLGRKGFDVEVFESRPDLRKVDISAGKSINLALANRGIAALKAAGIFDQVEKILTSMKGRMLHDESGDLSFQQYGSRNDEQIYSVSRGDLTALLMSEAEATGHVKIHFNHKITHYDLERNKFFGELQGAEQGRDFNGIFHLLLGCDGSGSLMRKQIMGTDSFERSFHFLEHGYKELTMVSKDGKWPMDGNSLHIWPRGDFMLIALPNHDKSFTVTLFLPKNGPESFEKLNNKNAVAAFFSKYFSDVPELIPDYIVQFSSNPLGILGTIYSDQWNDQDKVLILGDAAHGIVPFHGQGMNCGFEDCLQLDSLLDSEDNWKDLFSKFYERRKVNCDAIAGLAIENYEEMRSLVRHEKFQLMKEVSFELEKKWPTKFVPRYSMVMFREVPYSVAKERGEIQKNILDACCENATSLGDVNWQLAGELIESQLRDI